MQVFIPYPSPIEVAKCIDPLRRRKQIIECEQILDAMDGKSTAWKNHPITKMYAKDRGWLVRYLRCLQQYESGNTEPAKWWSSEADLIRPKFITDALCDQHKRRLFTKAPELYPQFADFGTSEENWYVVNGKTVKYIDGKKI